MHTYSMAVDVGASSGRCMLGWMEDGKIRLEEVHRFQNGPEGKGGVLVWDADRLFHEIVAGLKKAAVSGRKPISLGVDTWGVDYILIDANGDRIGDAVSYRDSRTNGMDDVVAGFISPEDLYARTGTQFMLFNTIFQLQALKRRHPEQLERADSMLLMPEYLMFRLTGVKKNEYTNSSTTQLIDARTCDWDFDLIRLLGYPERIFGKIEYPGTKVGNLLPEIREEIGYDLDVILPCTHDTASAILALPTTTDDSIYISSGTWSLMGIERFEADCRDICRRSGFTNEGGYQKRYRFLKNIMGLWMVQSLRREICPDRGFDELIRMARGALSTPALVDVDSWEFFAPESMKTAILEHCRKAGGPVPATDADIVACAYNSLAKRYAECAANIEELSGRTFDRINIIGGGSQDDLLNGLTARATGKDVYAGPVEATAIGNVLAQMLSRGEFAGLNEARQAVADSFEVRKVEI